MQKEAAIMKVLLINPPFTNYGGMEGHGGKAPSINLGYLAAYIRQKNRYYKVSILDSEVLGLTFENIESRIKDYMPDVVGITSSTPAYSSAVIIAGISKKVNRDITVVIGGVHPSALPQDTIREENIDFVVCGEGEITLFELLEAIKEKRPFRDIDGIIFKEKGDLVQTRPRALIEDLDILPFPARDLMPHNLYGPPVSKHL